MNPLPHIFTDEEMEAFKASCREACRRFRLRLDNYSKGDKQPSWWLRCEELHSQGMPDWEICEVLYNEGFRNKNGSRIESGKVANKRWFMRKKLGIRVGSRHNPLAALGVK